MISNEEHLLEIKEALVEPRGSVRLEATYLCFNFIQNCENQSLISYFIKNVDLTSRLIQNLDGCTQTEMIRISLELIDLILSKEKADKGPEGQEFSESFERGGGLDAIELVQRSPNRELVGKA